jgi:hypothetical protein
VLVLQLKLCCGHLGAATELGPIQSGIGKSWAAPVEPVGAKLIELGCWCCIVDIAVNGLGELIQWGWS